MDTLPPLIVPPKRKSTFAILSLVFSCCSLFTPFLIGSIGGITFGHLAIRDFKRDPALEGRWMAKWGLIIGYVSIPLIFVSGFIILHLLGHNSPFWK